MTLKSQALTRKPHRLLCYIAHKANFYVRYCVYSVIFFVTLAQRYNNFAYTSNNFDRYFVHLCCITYY